VPGNGISGNRDRERFDDSRVAQAMRRDIDETRLRLPNGKPAADADLLTLSFGGRSYFALLGSV